MYDHVTSISSVTAAAVHEETMKNVYLLMLDIT